MDLGLAGWVAIVTGGSRGWGAPARLPSWGVRVTRIAVGRMGRSVEVGDAVAFLASERAGSVTGAAWHLEGGAARTI